MNTLRQIAIGLLVYPQLALAGASGVDQAVASARQQLATLFPGPTDTVRISVKQPDNRLTLSKCGHPPKAETTDSDPKSGKLTVKVQCNTPRQWSIYLPSEVLQRVNLWSSSRPIDRGAILTAGDLEQQQLWLTQPPSGALQDPARIIGMEARRSIRTGNIIKQHLLKPPLIVHKGHRLNATLVQAGFSLSAEVVAQEDGADGDTIKVKNAKTDKLLWAWIDDDGQLIIH